MISSSPHRFYIVLAMFFAIGLGIIATQWYGMRQSQQYRAEREPAREVFLDASIWRVDNLGSYAGFRHADARVSADGQTVQVRYEADGKLQCLGDRPDGAFVDKPCTLFGSKR